MNSRDRGRNKMQVRPTELYNELEVAKTCIQYICMPLLNLENVANKMNKLFTYIFFPISMIYNFC